MFNLVLNKASILVSLVKGTLIAITNRSVKGGFVVIEVMVTEDVLTA